MATKSWLKAKASTNSTPDASKPAWRLLLNAATMLATNGLAGVEGSGGAIDIELNRSSNRALYGAYRVLINQTTGFVQKFKWQQSSGLWIEQD